MRHGTIRRFLLAGTVILALIAAIFGTTPASALAAFVEEPYLSIVLIPQTDTRSLSDGMDTYRVEVRSHGEIDVRQVTATIPFASGYRFVGASFSRSGTWISRIGENSIDIRIVRVVGDDAKFMATLRFASRDTVMTNAVIDRASVTWPGDMQETPSVSNLPLTLFPATIASTTEALEGEAMTYSFRANTFATGEPVSLWYTSDAGVSVALVTEGDLVFPKPPKDPFDDDEKVYGHSMPADLTGELMGRLKITDIAPGTYTLAARGGWSGVTAFATFTVR